MNRIAVLSESELQAMLEQAVFMGVKNAMEAVKKDIPVEMTEAQASEYLGIAQNTLRIWRSQKKGPKYHKSGFLVRYSRTDLDEYLKMSEIKTVDFPD